MAKKLSVIAGTKEGLGLPTIMERELAARHGAQYVRLAAFAIDVDRVRAEVETEELDPADWPFAWEVFLTGVYVERYLDGGDDGDRELLEAACEAAMAKSLDAQGEVMGGQLPFSVWEAVHRGALPRELRSIFAPWRDEPKEIAKALAALRAQDDAASRLARACLDVILDPPLSPPTKEALAALAR